jgi:polyisoprenoid-binding protein YceI
MTNPNTATRATGYPRTRRYQIDPTRSAVTFRTRHIFGLGAVTGTVVIQTGEIVVDSAGLGASVHATLSAASFDTDNPTRDHQVRSAKFLDVERYPTLAFRADTLSEEQGGWVLAGELQVRSVSQPFRLLVDSVDSNDTDLRAHASGRVDRYAFGLTALKGVAARYLHVDIIITSARHEVEDLRPLHDVSY